MTNLQKTYKFLEIGGKIKWSRNFKRIHGRGYYPDCTNLVGIKTCFDCPLYDFCQHGDEEWSEFLSVFEEHPLLSFCVNV